MIEVPFEGECRNGIYIIGEAPGQKEEMTGRPFQGPSGGVLNATLMHVGISRDDCRVANVMRTRPHGNDFEKFYLDKKLTQPSPELLTGRQFLIDDILRVRPKVVVALGNEPLVTLMGHRGVTNWRGSILWSELAQVKVIPTVHPAMILRQWDFFPLFQCDFRRVREESSRAEMPNQEKRVINIAPSHQQALEWLTRLKDAEVLSFDIETTNWNLMTSIALAPSPWEVFVIPFTQQGGDPYWKTESEELDILIALKKVLEGPARKIASNAQFDMSVLAARSGIHVKNLYRDTMICQHLCYPELPKSLDVMTSMYTTHPYYKHWRHNSSVYEFWRYNGTDALVTFEVAQELEKEMAEFGLVEFYEKNMNPLLELLLKMQLRGVLIDEGVRAKAKEDLTREAAEAQASLDGIVGGKLNVNSPKQIKDYLYGKLGLPTRISRKTGNPTVDKETLESLLIKHPREDLRLILKIREDLDQLENHLSAPLAEGRIHTSYNIGGRVTDVEGNVKSAPETGRLSSSYSPAMASGTNLQNVSRGHIRRMFIPDIGKVFLSSDLRQAEARLVAYLADDHRLIEAFAQGDPYIAMASQIFGRAAETISEDERYLAKRMVLALNYMMGVDTFALYAQIGIPQARRLREKYFETYYGLTAWHAAIAREIQEKRVLVTPFGRRRQFFGRGGDTLIREAVAYVPQSTIGDLLNMAMLRMERSIDGADWQISLQVHDQFIIQVPEVDVQIAITKMKSAFNIEIPLPTGRSVVIPNDFKVGPSWGDLKELTFDEGTGMYTVRKDGPTGV